LLVRARSATVLGMAASLVGFRVESRPASAIIGRKVVCKMGHPDGNPIPALWSQCFGDGTIEKLQAYPALREPVPAFGFIGNLNHETQTFDYMVAALTDAGATPFPGAIAIGLPGLRYAVGTIEGGIHEIFCEAPALVLGEMAQRGLARNTRWDFEMEGYDERFQHAAPTTTIEFWIPLEG